MRLKVEKDTLRLKKKRGGQRILAQAKKLLK